MRRGKTNVLIPFAKRSKPESKAVGAALINVGSLVAVKGHALLLRAMRLVVAELPEARLRIVGDGVLEGALRRQVAELGLTKQVSLDGAVAHELLANLYRGASLFVQTSLHEAEGMAVLEAAACGVPAVGTAVGVLPELGELGAAVVTEPDERALADGMLALLRDPVRRAGMGQAARATIVEYYGVATCVARFADGYAEIVSRMSHA